MAGSPRLPQGAQGWIAPHWRIVRRLLVGIAVACGALAVMVTPALVARSLSGDGVLEPATGRRLYVAQACLLAAAAGALLLRRRWTQCTPGRERVVLGAAMGLTSIAVFAVLAEAGLSAVHRFVKPLGAERHYFFEYDPVLGWKHRPGSVATFKRALVVIDDDGFRVTGHERGAVQSRVLLLGDSQAFGDGVGAEDTFAARLEAAAPGLWVLNAAVIGYGTDQQLLYFEHHGKRHAPDVTILALNAYDLRDNLSTRVRSGYAKPRFVMSSEGLTLTNVPVPGDAPADRLQRELQRSHLVRLLWRLWRNAAEPDDEQVPARTQLAMEVYPDDAQLARGFSVTAAIVDRLARGAREAESRLVVLFLPYQLDFEGDPQYARRTDFVLRSLQEQAAGGGFTVVDGRRGLASAPPDRLFLDSMHLSPEGHQRIAEQLQGALTQDTQVFRK